MLEKILTQIYDNREIVNYETDWQKKCRELDKRIGYHRSVEYPKPLLEVFRPREDPSQKLYRQAVYLATGSKTKPQIGTVETALERIQQSDDFKVVWNTDPKETGIYENATRKQLKDYLEGDLPLYHSLQSWLFGPCKTEMIWGPNSFVVFLPELKYFQRTQPGEFDSEFDQGASPKPYPRIFDADDVVWVDPVFAMFETGEYKDKNTKETVTTFLAVTKDEVAIIERRVAKDNTPDVNGNYRKYDWTEDITPYFCGILPVFPIGHLIDEIENEKKVYKSVISNGLSNLNTAARINDDLEMIQTFHIYPKEWEIRSEDCRTCNGTSWIANNKNERIPCPQCHGSGDAVESPQNVISISAKKLQEMAENAGMKIPFPPGGYFERPTEIYKIYKEAFEAECYNFFCSCNIQFLTETPLNQSGTAKEVDKEEVHTFFYPNAVQFAYLYKACAMAAYFQLYAPEVKNALVTKEQALKTIPEVTVPSEFQVKTSGQLEASLAVRIEKDMDPKLIQGGTEDLLKKQWGENSEEVKKYQIRIKLDPLAQMKPADRSIAFLDRTVSQFDYVLSNKFEYFLNDALEQNPKFYEMERSEQKAILKKLVDAEVSTINKNLMPTEVVPVGG